MNEQQNKVQCNGCEFLQVYDYVHKCYYCNNENRTNDMGKLGVGSLPDGSPEWCPKRCFA